MKIDNPNYTSSDNLLDISNAYTSLKYVNTYEQKPGNEIYNKRHIDSNKYYIMKYQSESHILKLIIFFCGLSLIGCLFYLKGLIGETLYIIYLGIIISIGIIMVIYNMYKLIYRDYYYFDESNYGYMSYPGTDMSGQDMKKIEKKSNVESSKNNCN
jgi:uncharacterized membrane protein